MKPSYFLDDLQIKFDYSKLNVPKCRFDCENCQTKKNFTEINEIKGKKTE